MRPIGARGRKMSKGYDERTLKHEPMSLRDFGAVLGLRGVQTGPGVWCDPFDLSDHPRFGPYAHADNPDTWLVRCGRCGFAQPESLPGFDDYFDLLYADQPWLSEESMRHDFEAGSKDFLFEEILGELSRVLSPDVPRTLLDIGSYTGRLLALAAAAGYEAEGIELNTRAADFAARQTGRPIHRVKAQDWAETGRRYGVVTLIDVLEHIPQPAPLVERLGRLLVPGGVLVVKLPHGPMQRVKERLRDGSTAAPRTGSGTRSASRRDTYTSTTSRSGHSGGSSTQVGLASVRVLTAAAGTVSDVSEGDRLRTAEEHSPHHGLSSRTLDSRRGRLATGHATGRVRRPSAVKWPLCRRRCPPGNSRKSTWGAPARIGSYLLPRQAGKL